MDQSVTVSVVIPVYNGAAFLATTLRSVLAQTRRDFEVIVVDDGSTDDTPRVAQCFGAAIRYIRQDNAGPGEARNAAIRQAQGDYIALLDADDEWTPVFLERMLALASAQPDADVFYCSGRCMDTDGRELPQVINAQRVSPEGIYWTLLRGNFLIPSAMMVRRSTLSEVGFFDPALYGTEDFDLWLRLAASRRFASTPECLIRYRLHTFSMSSHESVRMKCSVQRVIEKHFGADDCNPEDWPPNKRRAYGGLYRYSTVIAIQRLGDWDDCARYLRHALQVDPTLAADLDLFYELALGAQPVGVRGTLHQLDLNQNAELLSHALAEVFRPPLSTGLATLRGETYATACYAVGIAAYNTGQLDMTRRWLLRALRWRPRAVLDTRLVTTLAKSTLGHSGLHALHTLRMMKSGV